IVVGLLTRPAALMLCGVMTVAIVTAAAPEKHITASWHGLLEFFYLPEVLLLLLLAWLVFAGPGRASLAARLGTRGWRREPSSVMLGADLDGAPGGGRGRRMEERPIGQGQRVEQRKDDQPRERGRCGQSPARTLPPRTADRARLAIRLIGQLVREREQQEHADRVEMRNLRPAEIDQHQFREHVDHLERPHATEDARHHEKAAQDFAEREGHQPAAGLERWIGAAVEELDQEVLGDRRKILRDADHVVGVVDLHPAECEEAESEHHPRQANLTAG